MARSDARLSKHFSLRRTRRDTSAFQSKSNSSNKGSATKSSNDRSDEAHLQLINGTSFQNFLATRFTGDLSVKALLEKATRFWAIVNQYRGARSRATLPCLATARCGGACPSCHNS